MVTTWTDTLNSSESIWPPPFSTGVYRNEEPSPEGQRDKEIPPSQFISSLFEGVGQLLPGNLAGLLMCRPRLLAAWDSCCQKVLQRFSWKYTGCLENNRLKKDLENGLENTLEMSKGSFMLLHSLYESYSDLLHWPPPYCTLLCCILAKFIYLQYSPFHR